MADWIAYYRVADGVLVGCGTVPPEAVPPEIGTRNYGAVRPDEGLVRWDTTLRDFVAVPPEVLIDRLADAIGHPYIAAAWSRLTAAQRTTLRKYLVWLLGTHRYRHATEEVALDVDPSWPTDPANVSE
jgi:hypothetical protein